MQCPKCGYEQIPADTCGACGIVFSKYYELKRRQAEKPLSGDNVATREIEKAVSSAMASDTPRFLADWLRPASLPWSPVSTPGMTALSIGFAVVIYLLATVGAQGQGSSAILFMIHNVNLVFHEAGHWIFGVLGNDTLMILGGSLNQLLIPLVVAVAFWSRRDAVGFAFALFWMFENLLDVAVYMADARALELPLIGGLGEEAHDWRNLFLRWNLLAKDTLFARYVRNIGWLGMCSIWAWLIWQWVVNKGSERVGRSR